MTAQTISAPLSIRTQAVSEQPKAEVKATEEVVATQPKRSLFQRLFNTNSVLLGLILAMPLSLGTYIYTKKAKRAEEARQYDIALEARRAAEKKDPSKKERKIHAANPVREKSANILAYINENFPDYSSKAEQIVADIEEHVDPMVRQKVAEATDGVTQIGAQTRFMLLSQANARKYR